MADVTDKDLEAARAGGFITLGVNEYVLARDAERAIAAARAEGASSEREACALECEAQGPPADTRHNPLYRDAFDDGVCTCADAIRARGEQADVKGGA